MLAARPPARPPAHPPPHPPTLQVASLEAERKELLGQKLNEKHGNLGSLLLGVGVLISVSGALNTFLRTGGCCGHAPPPFVDTHV